MGILIATTEKESQAAGAMSAVDSSTNKWFDAAARGECGWICPDCCISAPKGMPDECMVGCQRCTEIIKRDKARANQPSKGGDCNG